MANDVPPPKTVSGWSPEAYSMAEQARVLSGNKLEELVIRLQRRSGRSSDQCWRFIIQNGLKRRTDHRRWNEEEVDEVREELVRRSLEEVANRLHRSPEAIRSMLRRRNLSIREIRCDRFSIESLSAALRIHKSEIHYWIDQGWLQATVEIHGHKRLYVITPEALSLLYRRHLAQLLARGAPNLSLFEAYLQYCYSPKHTVGSQILDVRRDKKERAAFAALHDKEHAEVDDETGEDDRYRFNVPEDLPSTDEENDFG